MKMRIRQIVRQCAVCGLCLCVAAIGWGAAPAGKPGDAPAPAATAEAPKAWMDANPLVMFPVMDATLPSSPGRFSASITQGLARIVKPATIPGGPVRLAGDRYPSLSSLRIDLSNAATVPERSKVKLLKESPIRPGVAADSFAIVAQPLRLYSGNINYSLSASDAVLDLRLDKDKKHTLLVLENAASGNLALTAKISDLQAALAGAIDNALGGTGMSVQSVKLKIDSSGPHSLHADATISVAEILLPSADAHVEATIDVDDALNGTIHNLKVSGQGMLGSAFIDLFSGSIKDYQDKTRPLMAFPTGKIELKSIQFNVSGETLTVNGTFAGTKATTQPSK
jgi:hypothetical protein